jgi:cation-transporting ATPase E
MTGDGVNDILALKQADLGIAMGSGAPAVRAVAQLVLVDNRFSSLPSVVAEGRRVLANIEKLALLFLSKTVYAVIFAFVIGAIARPYPFLPRHLTLVNAVSIGIPSFVLAFAPNEQRYLPGFVKRVLRRAAPFGVAVAAFTLFVYEIAYREMALERMRTVSVIALLIGSFVVLLLASRPLSRWRVALVAAMIGLSVIAFALPVARHFYALRF